MEQFNLFPVARRIVAIIHGQHILYTHRQRLNTYTKKTIHVLVKVNFIQVAKKQICLKSGYQKNIKKYVITVTARYKCTVGAKEMFTLLKQQKIFLAKQGIKFYISLSLLSVGGV